MAAAGVAGSWDDGKTTTAAATTGGRAAASAPAWAGGEGAGVSCPGMTGRGILEGSVPAPVAAGAGAGTTTAPFASTPAADICLL